MPSSIEDRRGDPLAVSQTQRMMVTRVEVGEAVTSWPGHSGGGDDEGHTVTVPPRLSLVNCNNTVLSLVNITLCLDGA